MARVHAVLPGRETVILDEAHVGLDTGLLDRVTFGGRVRHDLGFFLAIEHAHGGSYDRAIRFSVSVAGRPPCYCGRLFW